MQLNENIYEYKVILSALNLKTNGRRMSSLRSVSILYLQLMKNCHIASHHYAKELYFGKPSE